MMGMASLSGLMAMMGGSLWNAACGGCWKLIAAGNDGPESLNY